LLAVSVLVPLPILALTVRMLSERLRIAVRKQRRKEGLMADYMHEAIAATPVLQSLGSGGHVVRHFAQANRRNARAGLKTARAAARLSGVVEMLLAVAFATALALGAQRVLAEHLSAGELIVFLSYVRSLLKPIRAAAKHQGRIAKGAASGERLLDVLDEGLELRESAGNRVPSLHPRRLTFEGVEYTYPDGTQALRGIDLACERGEITALVGPSGSGKSTLVSLALRLFDPSAGCIRIDGVSLPEMDLDELRRRFALSMQATVLLGETIHENLLLGEPEASEAEMWSALESAGLERAVRALPEGLATVLGTAGGGLSGGEARRLCFARALLRQAPILILDEPFAGLDGETAALVADTLRAQARDRIVLIITHQVQHLGCAAKVLHLCNGRSAPTLCASTPAEVCG
jgi:ATP-binding cassette subfamily B protein